MATTHERAGHQPGMTDLREYTKDISMTDDIDWILAKIHAKPKREPVTRGAGRPSLASQGARHSLLDSKSRSSFGYGMPNSPRSHALQQDDTEENESQKTVAHIKTALNAMAQPETFTQGDTQAASLPSAPQHPIPDNVKLEYNYGNLYHERTTTQIIQHQAKELAKEIGGLTRSGQIILCQCGYSKEEGDMVSILRCCRRTLKLTEARCVALIATPGSIHTAMAMLAKTTHDAQANIYAIFVSLTHTTRNVSRL